MNADGTYPNSPLTDVVFEIRFSGEPRVECHRDDFFDLVRSEFPQVLVPKLQAGEAVALSPYHFVSLEGDRALMTALNLFAYRTSAYPGFAGFKEESLRWMQTFGGLYGIKTLNRTGLRYINAIPFGSPDVPVTRLFNLSLGLGELVPQQFTQFLLITEIPAEIPGGSGSVTIKLGAAEKDGEPVVMLDFDLAVTGELDFENLDQYLEASHLETKRLFEGLVTDEYRAYLKGEAIT